MTSIVIVFAALLLLLFRNVFRGKKMQPWLRLSLIFCAFYLTMLCFIGGIYNVPSESMQPTLKTGDYIVGVKIGGLADNGEIQRGDVVIFNAPAVPRTFYIKRVIGVAGDVISYQPDKTFTINGVKTGTLKYENDKIAVFKSTGARSLQEYEYLIDKTVPFLKSRDKWVVPVGYYFMAGDNRDHSWDSRYWENPPGTPQNRRGLVRKDQIVARYVVTLFNLNLINTYDPLEGALRVIRKNAD
ncbi:signal peptidase I [Cronobacter turicensis]